MKFYLEARYGSLYTMCTVFNTIKVPYIILCIVFWDVYLHLYIDYFLIYVDVKFNRSFYQHQGCYTLDYGYDALTSDTSIPPTRKGSSNYIRDWKKEFQILYFVKICILHALFAYKKLFTNFHSILFFFED